MDINEVDVSDKEISSVTLKFDLKEFLKQVDVLNIIFEVDGEIFKKIQIKRR
ncbi:MAG: hypothetical protein IJ715_03925 [Bacilli bacterium]|nr:hypothetical protein [Bacilli bacterium]